MEISIKTVTSARCQAAPLSPHRVEPATVLVDYQGVAWQCQCIWQGRSDGQP
jgi:hypothetical protein